MVYVKRQLKIIRVILHLPKQSSAGEEVIILRHG